QLLDRVEGRLALVEPALRVGLGRGDVEREPAAGGTGGRRRVTAYASQGGGHHGALLLPRGPCPRIGDGVAAKKMQVAPVARKQVERAAGACRIVEVDDE